MTEEIVSGGDHPDLLSNCIKLASSDPERNPLLLADLYPPHLSLSEIYILTRNGIPVDFSTVYRGFSYPSVVLGTKDRTKKRLLQYVLPKVSGMFGCACEAKELELFAHRAEILELHNEIQMILRRLDRPIEIVGQKEAEAVQRSELDALDHFYKENGAAAWLPIQFEAGPYYCFRIEGDIVSAAGVHFATPEIAQLGNIVTTKAYRKRGYATLCTHALASSLSVTNRIVSLFVAEDNREAIQIYEKIGFRQKRKIIFASFSSVKQ